MHDCTSCRGGCSCGGCARELTLGPAEVYILRTLAQIPFLPIARQIDDASPIYLEDDAYTTEEYSRILQLLEHKGLITLDFDRPLKDTNPGPYAAWPIQGSMALTARGQGVVDLLELQGAE